VEVNPDKTEKGKRFLGLAFVTLQAIVSFYEQLGLIPAKYDSAKSI
jgi:hypothetical protein